MTTMQPGKQITQEELGAMIGPVLEPEDVPAHDSIQGYYDAMIEKVGPDATPQQVIRFMDQIAGFVQAAKQLKNDLDQAIIAWIEEHDDLTVDNSTRYYVGNSKTTKCIDMKRVGRELLEHCGGDIDQLVGFIKSEGFKHGSVKSALGPEVFDKLYYTQERQVLREGKPKPVKVLKKTNPLTTITTPKGAKS